MNAGAYCRQYPAGSVKKNDSVLLVLRRIIPLFWISMLCSGCGNGNPKEEDAVARVFDSYLSRNELKKAIPYGSSSRDSAALAKDYIDQWIRRKVVLRKAELNLTDEQKDVQQQLEDYRSSLLIFAYERELIRQKLDTNVSESEIERYYNSNPANFELKSHIVRLKYIKLPLKAPNADKARAWLKASDMTRLEQYCRLYAVNYLLDDANWILFDDVLKEIPLDANTIGSHSGKPRYMELRDKEYQYLLIISGFMVKDSHAPLSFERNNIRNIILNKRKILLIREMQENAYNDALNDKNIELYAK